MVQGDLKTVKDSSAQDVLVAHHDNGGNGRGQAKDLNSTKINGSVNNVPVC
jgi:hypothetical protein